MLQQQLSSMRLGNGAAFEPKAGQMCTAQFTQAQQPPPSRARALLCRCTRQLHPGAFLFPP
eukprot:6202367-Pleurochrysis_carterae.AAC.1